MSIVSRHLTSVAQFLPAAMLFAGLVLGGPDLMEDQRVQSSSVYGGTGTGVGQENPQCPPQGCIHTGTNENLYDPASKYTIELGR